MSRPWREWFDALRNAFVRSLDSAEDAAALDASGPGQADAADILARLDDLERDMAAMASPTHEPAVIHVSQDGEAIADVDAIDCQGLILAERAGAGVSVSLREPVFADGDIVTAEGEYVVVEDEQ